MSPVWHSVVAEATVYAQGSCLQPPLRSDSPQVGTLFPPYRRAKGYRFATQGAMEQNLKYCYFDLPWCSGLRGVSNMSAPLFLLWEKGQGGQCGAEPASGAQWQLSWNCYKVIYKFPWLKLFFYTKTYDCHQLNLLIGKQSSLSEALLLLTSSNFLKIWVLL